MMPNFNEMDEQQAALLTRMAHLIARKRMGELDPVQVAELDQWLAESPEHRIWLEQLDNEEYLAGMQADFSSAEGNLEASLRSFHDQFMEMPVRAINPASRFNWSWAAAAVLVPLIGLWVWLAERPSTPVGKPAPVLADVKPGGSRATLTLGNGNQILLDTGVAGQLVQKGGVQVRYNKGLVNYQAAKLADSEVTYNVLTTAKGGEYQLVLPDGSKVWLNAASSLRYPTAFTGKDRHVELTGEAYFEVAQQKDHPFSVSVGTMDVKVLGTEFDIMAYPEENRKLTTLVQGAVKVENGSEVRKLAVGDQAAVGGNGEMSVASNVNVESVIAWKLGFFQFSNIDLKTMMREIARWYDIDVVYQRNDLSGTYGGRISRKLNLSDLISLLEGNGVGHFKMEGRKLIVLP